MIKTEYKLKNGLRVLLLDTQAFPSVATLLLVSAGSRYENKKNNGIAHFFEHMAFKGSQKYPSALSISTLLDGIGSQQNAFTSKDHTGYWIKAPLKHFATVIDVLSEMLLHSLLKSEEVEREKGVIIEEINMYEDLPQYKVWDVFEDIIFPHSPLGYPTTGTKEIVSSFNRQTFTNYMDCLYRPNNAVLVVAGGLNGQESTIKEQIEAKFGSWQPKPTQEFVPINQQQARPQTNLISKATEQAHFVIGYPAFSRSSRHKYGLNVLTAILGGGMSSRLFYELRERRGLCYYIQSGMELYEETGYMYTRAGVNVSQVKIEQAISLIIKEQQKIIQAKLKKDELNKAKEMIKGRTILALEDSFDLASFFGKRELFDQSEKDLETVLNKIDQVSLEEVIELAKQILKPDKLNLALISPHKKIKI
ncbi:hypothetical protein A2209_01310 [Candidatus Roizmanbacteria bacterium RIFOXYA1_FULL_41_12]|uniref:Peptidase M16 n=1 Tax=Candidatus Roizmanbacteria bacterium RIFOXYA1_FULL_41_12 TaxID=1802082 RepID=A0A1F7K9X9_9BACT|nr:MAG: hypothetical protein A2209_01310 [Candidatus Roizmanbacteria bacterium RIFOXYA1_FULL_41_12]OGK66714.1 MAG: hypothetical protein A2377_02285 [Candidatus Roizmanbacteria bacterium RIFOXYB1_FULL_41_27]OGK70912.1 MAG: hypothetical protein A2403_02425 [Candidatus Roizmanbacteria bacterium RIFOXYC1_FULL_41_16]OGK72597.1 MAG: hypothetical protein A2459_04445 [Candidatus Roizmanbacteria bacterium RIFOXYC2_FULL_41_10]OGK75509.1 MAG: hypothetical protein A2575_02280 [Candidatus Roizmanbacteria ba